MVFRTETVGGPFKIRAPNFAYRRNLSNDVARRIYAGPIFRWFLQDREKWRLADEYLEEIENLTDVYKRIPCDSWGLDLILIVDPFQAKSLTTDPLSKKKSVIIICTWIIFQW